VELIVEELQGAPVGIDLVSSPIEGLCCPEDVDESGAVDFGDILAILWNWGFVCP